MSLGTDLAAAVSIINVDSALLRAVVQGPASGPNSTVLIPATGALVKTLSRIAAESAGPYASWAGGTFTGIVSHSNVGHDQIHFNQVDAAYNSDMMWKRAGAGHWLLSHRTASNWDMQLLNIPRGVPDLHISYSSGNVGIGTSTPNRKLEVNGIIRALVAGTNFDVAQGFELANPNTGADQRVLQISGINDGTAIFRNACSNFNGFQFWVGNASRLVLLNNGHIIPGVDNAQNFGSASQRLAVIYAGTGTINTSDARQKRWGSLLSSLPGLVQVGLMIPEIIGTFQFLQSIEEKGKAAFDALAPEVQANTSPTELGESLARWHIGLTVQELVALFDTVRLSHPDLPTPAQLGLYGRDDIKTKVPRTITERRPVMVDEDYTDVEYTLSENGDQFVAHSVTKTKRVPAPPVMKPVVMPGGQPRMIKVGDRPTGVMDSQGRPIMEPIFAQEVRSEPVTEAVEITVYDEVDQGEYVLSIRPDQIHYLCIGAAHIARKELAAKVDAQEARLAALEIA